MADEAKLAQVTKSMVIINAIDMMELYRNGLPASLSKSTMVTLMLF